MVHNDTNKPRGIIKSQVRYGLTDSDFRLTRIVFAGPRVPPSSFYSISGETVDYLETEPGGCDSPPNVSYSINSREPELDWANVPLNRAKPVWVTTGREVRLVEMEIHSGFSDSDEEKEINK